MTCVPSVLDKMFYHVFAVHAVHAMCQFVRTHVAYAQVHDCHCDCREQLAESVEQDLVTLFLTAV